MELLLIIALVLALYLKTLDYKYVIDDNVKRQGYMYEVPLQAPAPDFFNTKPSRYYRLFMIGMHCVNVSIIYLLWGWAPALIFAVHPVCVWGTAWVTGNYYATTAYFTLIAYYILHTWPTWWGAAIAMPFFISALNSTVCAINFPFIFLFCAWVPGLTPWGLTMLLPLAWYLQGRKFTTGIKIRKSFVEGKKVPRELKLDRLILMTKVIGKYTFTSIYPDRLGLFGGWGNELNDNPEAYKQMHAADKDFWRSLALIAAVAGVGCYFSPFGTIWFFVIIALHSQFNLMGQFYAERYLYLPLVGLCIVAGAAMASHPIAITVLATVLVVRTYFFIPVWRNMETIWLNDRDTYPEFGEVYSNLAQYYMNRKPLAIWRINEICSYLQRADEACPGSWKIKMNLGCFAAIMGQWDRCLEYTNQTIAIIEKIGGTVTPIDMLKKQKEDVENILRPKPEAANGFALKQKEEPNGTRTKTSSKDSTKRVAECV